MGLRPGIDIEDRSRTGPQQSEDAELRHEDERERRPEDCIPEGRGIDIRRVEHHALCRYVSIRYSERRAKTDIEPSVRSVGGSDDNAPAETINFRHAARTTSEHHDLADCLTGREAFETFIDLVERDPVRHQLLDRQLPGLHHGGEARDVAHGHT